MLTQRCGEHILDVGGEDHVPVVLVCLESESVDHVHHSDDGFKCLLWYISYKRYSVYVQYMMSLFVYTGNHRRILMNSKFFQIPNP